MKRWLTLTVVGSMAVAGLVVASPVQASEVAPPCVENAPDSAPLGTVYVDDAGRLHANPDAAGSDLDNVVAWAPGWAVYWVFCVEERLPTNGAWCLAGVALDIASSMDPLNFSFRYVYQSGNEWVVDVPAAAADAGRIYNCTGISLQ